MNVGVSSEEQVLGRRSESVGIVCKSSGKKRTKILGSIHPTEEIRLKMTCSLT